MSSSLYKLSTSRIFCLASAKRSFFAILGLCVIFKLSLLTKYHNPNKNVVSGNQAGKSTFQNSQNQAAETVLQMINKLGQQTIPNLDVYIFQELYETVRTTARDFPNINRQNPNLGFHSDNGTKQKITVATVACGTSYRDALVMAKSAVMFSQHAHLHLIVFTDQETVATIGKSLLKLKWSVQELGWDFSFQLRLDWFPPADAETWKSMWKPCTTQRLFFPSLLPNVDSLIYLDADTIVTSNLSVLWSQFSEKMGQGQVGAMSANTENGAMGWYRSKWNKVPYYGKGGLNAGVMLMNLTRMREFQFQTKAIQIYKEFKKTIFLADQDIMNIMFYKSPEKMTELSCTFNFIARHCPLPGKSTCYLNSFTEEPVCYCKDIERLGVSIVHGNLEAFHTKDFPFLKHTFQQFEKFDILEDSYDTLLKRLVDGFKSLKSPCFSLTAEQLYGNAMAYLSVVV